MKHQFETRTMPAITPSLTNNDQRNEMENRVLSPFALYRNKADISSRKHNSVIDKQ